MSLANLLPPMTKSWADEVNDDFEEQFFRDIISTSYAVDTSRLDHDIEMEDVETLPPDFTDYEALDFSDEEYILDSYYYNSEVEMMSNNEGADVVISSEEILAFNANALGKYIAMNIPRSFLPSLLGSDAGTSFNIELDNEEQNATSRDEDHNDTTSSVETSQNYNNHPPGYLDSQGSNMESVENSPELGNSEFWNHGSNHSSQTEDDEELYIDHPLMGKDVICIRETFAKVKICEYDAHPSKKFYRGWEPKTWKWAPSSLRCCQTVVRAEEIE
ncbi:predicted protein [Sclerotinia sclerotiorum 1980 UF-70]|uniref:Uncharacterized protein n=2 Tax=Sclerotinia sclerotiorum (strain ATCC 18683 / 1980 / Ss-1) TaxID=665079 RepID=A7E826_SCLS1|nr:predicted protein [Sclerotinia sclerotiorum 1980 UF-70]APA06103.1 hypothetical protein sscle_01g008730 [Sclerotinia sclerotiorum 1980 UF-70]EDN96528.1 predicted protein [Sclerotinia sclerotiorum 1980 UF-70]